MPTSVSVNSVEGSKLHAFRGGLFEAVALNTQSTQLLQFCLLISELSAASELSAPLKLHQVLG